LFECGRSRVSLVVEYIVRVWEARVSQMVEYIVRMWEAPG